MGMGQECQEMLAFGIIPPPIPIPQVLLHKIPRNRTCINAKLKGHNKTNWILLFGFFFLDLINSIINFLYHLYGLSVLTYLSAFQSVKPLVHEEVPLLR